MFTNKMFSLFFLMLSLCVVGDIAIEFPQTCAINDGECQMKMMEFLFRSHDKTGFPEFGIPPYNPYRIQNTTVSILGMVNMTMVDGIVEGATNCSFIKIETNIENGYVNSESFCELFKMSGHYTIVAGTILSALSGNSVSGDGIGSIQIDNMTLKMKIPFNVKKNESDGEIYIVPQVSKAEYSTNDIKKITFTANNVMLGNREVSQSLMTFMNNNWSMLLRSFGKYFSDKVMEVFFENVEKFFLTIPARNYFSDDLSRYSS